jgi:hypothetical protein
VARREVVAATWGLCAALLGCTALAGLDPYKGSAPAPAAADGAADAVGGDAVLARDGGLAYRAAVLADKPVAYWRLGEAAGTLATDETGNGHTARYEGTCRLGAAGAIAGDPNGAVELDGTSCGLTGPTAVDFTGTAPFTFELWVRTTNLDTTNKMIFSKGASNAAGYQAISMMVNGARGIAFERYVDGVLVFAGAAIAALPAGLYTHVVAVYDGASLALWMNGVLVATSPDARSQPSKDAPVRLGMDFPGKGHLAGTLDEVAIYATALPAERIAVHHARGVGQ